ncbi:MAG: 5-carboxymethyl-2-hydroxymuconate isomerase [Desulfobacteraceae bacterium 4572_88]|nr:MAG: 5-carboxymethyl-2-hydroxymuconate isomerase [Desulfobacteraceae bacterium 4572_88]
MQIIRFLDENNEEHYGHQYQDNIATLLEGQLFGDLQDTGRQVRVKKLLTPLQPSVILCIGLNYRHHAEETGAELPKYPALFMKNPAAFNHPGDPIILPPICMDPPEVDYEAELAVVIGKTAKNVPASDALDYVLGYTAGNDVSARRWQKHSGAGQWVRGKSFDTFCPLGPVLVTPDEIPDPQTLPLKSVLNGNTMQESNTSDMIFPVAELIEYLSSGMTLLPGTVIMTGTPSGVGFVRQPPVFLQPGDVVEIAIEGISSLVNPVAAGK